MKYKPMKSIKYTGSACPIARQEAWERSKREYERVKKANLRFSLSVPFVPFLLLSIPLPCYFDVTLKQVLDSIPPFDVAWSRMLSAPVGRYILYDWHRTQADYILECPNLLSLLSEFAAPLLKLLRRTFKKHTHSSVALLGNDVAAPAQSTLHTDYSVGIHYPPGIPVSELPITLVVPLSGTRLIHLEHGDSIVPLTIHASKSLCVYYLVGTFMSLVCYM